MANKVLTSDSVLNEADLDGDGIVSNEELEKHERILKIENEDKKEDAQPTWRGSHCLVCYSTRLQLF